MSADLFRSLHQAGLLTAKQISFILKQAESAGYRWLEDYDPRLSQFMAVFSFCGNVEAERLMLAAITQGKPWVHEHIPESLDIDGNGELDTGDVFCSLTKALRTLADGIDTLRKDGSPSRRLTPSQTEELRQIFSEIIMYTLAGRRVVESLSPKPRRDLCRQSEF